MPIKYDNKTVYFSTQPVVFKHEIGDFIETDSLVFIRLNIPADVNVKRNVFAMYKDAKMKWQIESVLERFPKIEVELPFDNMSMLENGNLSVSDFFRRTFEININNGKILNFTQN